MVPVPFREAKLSNDICGHGNVVYESGPHPLLKMKNSSGFGCFRHEKVVLIYLNGTKRCLRHENGRFRSQNVAPRGKDSAVPPHVVGYITEGGAPNSGGSTLGSIRPKHGPHPSPMKTRIEAFERLVR